MKVGTEVAYKVNKNVFHGTVCMPEELDEERPQIRTFIPLTPSCVPIRFRITRNGYYCWYCLRSQVTITHTPARIEGNTLILD